MLVRRQSKQKMYYDKSVRFLKPVKANDKVYIRKDDIWVIGHVVRKFNDRSYLVKDTVENNIGKTTKRVQR
jgi:acyl dehydratase